MSLDTASKTLGKKLHCFLFYTKSTLFKQGSKRASTACRGRNTCAGQVSTALSHLQTGSPFYQGQGPETGFPFSCVKWDELLSEPSLAPQTGWLSLLFLLSNRILHCVLRPTHLFYECLLKALLHICTGMIKECGQTSLYIHTLTAVKTLSLVSPFTFSLWG